MCICIGFTFLLSGKVLRDVLSSWIRVRFVTRILSVNTRWVEVTWSIVRGYKEMDAPYPEVWNWNILPFIFLTTYDRNSIKHFFGRTHGCKQEQTVKYLCMHVWRVCGGIGTKRSSDLLCLTSVWSHIIQTLLVSALYILTAPKCPNLTQSDFHETKTLPSRGLSDARIARIRGQ